MKSLEEQISNRCIHFTGIMNQKCLADVNYKDVRIKPDEGMYKFPCVNTGGFCEKCQFPSKEDVEKKIKEMEETSLRAISAYAKIKSSHMVNGEVNCECGGIIRFSKAPSNGHIQCKCNKCDLSFME